MLRMLCREGWQIGAHLLFKHIEGCLKALQVLYPIPQVYPLTRHLASAGRRQLLVQSQIYL